MRWSTLFIPTLRDAPADAEALSHRLLVRGGFIRQLQSGHYSMLPLGWRVHRKVAEVIRQEMDAIGAQELLLPAMHPASVWQQSGRWESMGDEMFRLVDRKGADLVLGMTHEEVIALIGLELSSYRDLPQMWYQIQTKFRDEPRPKSGLLRVREFAMKDSYSIDIDDAGLDRSFDLHHHAYTRIFARPASLDYTVGRCLLAGRSVAASSRRIHGAESLDRRGRRGPLHELSEQRLRGQRRESDDKAPRAAASAGSRTGPAAICPGTLPDAWSHFRRGSPPSPKCWA